MNYEVDPEAIYRSYIADLKEAESNGGEKLGIDPSVDNSDVIERIKCHDLVPGLFLNDLAVWRIAGRFVLIEYLPPLEMSESVPIHFGGGGEWWMARDDLFSYLTTLRDGARPAIEVK